MPVPTFGRVVPTFLDRIVALPGIWIDHDGFSRAAPRLLDQRTNMLWRTAVNAECSHPGVGIAEPCHLDERCPVTDMPAVLATQAEPGKAIRCVGQKFEQDRDFRGRGDRLAGEQVCLALRQDPPALQVKGMQGRGADPVITAVLGSIGEIRAIGANTRRYQRLRPARASTAGATLAISKSPHSSAARPRAASPAKLAW